MKNIHKYLAPILVLSALTSNARSDAVTIGASKDNSIFQNVVDNSAGGAAGIFAGTAGLDASNAPRRGLIAFDVAAAVPAGATINAAQLTLYLGKSGGGASQSIELHRLNADWGEGTTGSSNPVIAGSGNGFPAEAGDATWNARFFGSSLWSNPGANGDYNATASATTSIPNILEAPYTWLSTPAMVSDVQNWLNAPATNIGWILINANEVNPGTARAFYSRSATLNASDEPIDPTFLPALTITYTIPEPAAAFLVLVAGPLVCLYRRPVRRAD